MNIYSSPGETGLIDLAAAQRELAGSSSIINEGERKKAVAEITAAALLDIALSLRTVAEEARLAMPDLVSEYLTDEEAAAESESNRDFLIVGDLVVVEGMDEPGEITALGVSEGAVWADVLFANGAEARAWQDKITRLVGDERDDDAMQEAAESSIAAIADEIEKLDPEDVVEDIDDDFDGDHHTAAATALDTLRENEAARKAAKKASKKGGKK